MCFSNGQALVPRHPVRYRRVHDYHLPLHTKCEFHMKEKSGILSKNRKNKNLPFIGIQITAQKGNFVKWLGTLPAKLFLENCLIQSEIRSPR